jgi:hypothetical protein
MKTVNVYEDMVICYLNLYFGTSASWNKTKSACKFLKMISSNIVEFPVHGTDCFSLRGKPPDIRRRVLADCWLTVDVSCGTDNNNVCKN